MHLGVDLLVVDVGGAMQLIDEGLTLYDDLDAALPAVGYTFREYRLAELAERASDAHRRSRAWWAARLAELPPAPALPTRSTGTAGRFHRRQRILDAARWSALQAAARARGVTPAAALCAAYAEVLANWSRQAPFTLNLTLFAKQPYHPDVPRVVGDFTAVTLLPFDPHGGADFAARAQAVQQTLWSTLEHTRISGVEVLRMLNEGRPLAEQARMPVVFTAALGATTVDPRVALGLDHMVHGVSQTPQVSLDHQAVEVGDRLVLNWDAVEERFPPGLLDAMFAAYCRALDALADGDAAWRAARWPSLPPDQAARRAKYLDTAGPEAPGTLFDAFDRQRTRAPDAPALIAERTLSYAEVAARAAAVQRALAVEPGALIAIAMPPHWAQAVAALGVLRAGAAYVPLDAAWPAARVDGIIERAGVTRVLTLSSLERDWPVPAIAVDTLAPDPSPPPPAPQDPRALAYVIYTSGSTGVPKGVVIDHRGAANTLADINDRFAVGPADRVLALSSLAFDLSVYDLFGLLAAGGAVAVPAPETAREPAAWLDRLRADRVTIWNTVPALMALLVEHAEQTGAELPASLRLILLSGDWIPVTLPDRIRALAPAPDAVEIISLGGATEGSIWSIIHPIGAVDRSRPSVPYGRPMRNQRMHVRHPDGAPCPEWAVGEIAIGGVGVALGYRDPARTAERFVEDDGERLYRTGDLGRMWPDGTMEFLGREDHQVKVGGHRIELGEIEATLLDHPAVSAAVVDVDGDPRRLVGWIVPRAGLSTNAWDAARTVPPPTVSVDDAAAMRADIEALDALAVAYMVRTLRTLGAFAEPGAPVAVDDLVARGVRPGYRPIMTDWLDALAARALLRRVDGAWVADTPLPALAIEPLLERARAVSHPDALALVQRMAAAHVDVLCDRRDAIEIFFADGLRFARAIYGELGPIRLEVARLARLIGAVVDALDRPARLDRDRRRLRRDLHRADRHPAPAGGASTSPTSAASSSTRPAPASATAPRSALAPTT
ncbi:MAG: amino acid adenylation domain-containing protein [bacterium]